MRPDMITRICRCVRPPPACGLSVVAAGEVIGGGLLAGAGRVRSVLGTSRPHQSLAWPAGPAQRPLPPPSAGGRLGGQDVLVDADLEADEVQAAGELGDLRGHVVLVLTQQGEPFLLVAAALPDERCVL